MVELQHTTSGIPGKMFCMEALFTAYKNEASLDQLMDYKSTSDTNTMYLHEAMKQTDSNNFNKTMQKE